MSPKSHVRGRVPAFVSAMVFCLGLLPATALAQVATDVNVEDNASGDFPPDLFVRVVSPPEYVNGEQEGTFGEWLGPDYTADGEVIDKCSIEWSVTFDSKSASSEAAARDDLQSEWPDVESGPITVTRYENDQPVEDITGHFILTREEGEGSANYEGTVGVPLGGGVYAVVGFLVGDPETDDYEVNGKPASEWNSDALHAAADAVALLGPLPTYGSSGDDDVEGTEEDEVMVLGGGNDTADGGDGDDVMKGQGGNDTAVGSGGNDKLVGGTGNDKLYGDEGPGGSPAASRYSAMQEEEERNTDTLLGGAGKDKLTGGPGVDVLKGGPGEDTCVFDEKEEVRKSTGCEKKARNF